MSIVETALIFVGIPALVVLLVAALVYGRAESRTPRYRPGGPWQFNPVWYLPHPAHSGPVSSLHSGEPNSHAGALEGAGGRQALANRVGGTGAAESGAAGTATAGTAAAETVTASGGASGEW